MSRDTKNLEWMKEFRSFIKGDDVAPPMTLSHNIFSKVRHDLFPSFQRVLGKLAAVHVLSAALMLMICPQLGVGPFVSEGHGIMMIFMHYGVVACAVACGSLFLGFSSVLAAVFLRREELREASRYGLAHVCILAAGSFAGLMLMGGSAERMYYFFWLTGAILGGFAILKVAAFFRLSLLRA